jgi:6-methylsalicylate decarboxylase
MTGRIDVHHHFMSQQYLDAVGVERAASPGSAGHVEPWSAEQSLEFMDAAGIAAAVISVSAPGIGLDSAEKTAALARTCNEAQATMVRDRPRRFGSLAILPLPDIEASLRELNYAYDALSADGVVVMSNYAGDYIGSRKFWPLFAELERRGSVVLVHPTLPHEYRGFPGVSLSTLEFPFDTARAIVSMLYEGTPEQFPNVKIIWSHAGGTMPYLAGRTAVLSRRNGAFRLNGDKLLPAMGRFFYDLTQSTNKATVAALRALVPLDQLLFGSDCPFAKEPQIRAALDELGRLGLGEEERRKIDCENAAALFPRLSGMTW